MSNRWDNDELIELVKWARNPLSQREPIICIKQFISKRQQLKSPQKLIVGYYVVKFYNHSQKHLMYFNGKIFEGFKSEILPNDEIEEYTQFTEFL